ncbi:hypothetical protein RHOFW510R12_03295 [Rhodanobacter sp. FW510-R12]|uniref:FRG domain-containing protein n=1 Tax=unclassified Rhodanobacter TaxID=2621553 RepID=UPI0007AA0349|nr:MULTISPECIES: FRG domain-containing protein [unclassified Rhodanobacter]KZC16884.1 hypothetical protein RHOFW104R8_13850 [Rhodanobacter sp. FW104-R8]KZC27233.1 hypothetical protein RhoFW510T8_16140 [Rhodanobacter sp. FW510-T8]KZC31670.1 hypothetical protein RhoFW510R10_16085 [Rhodanobacter sp. FW510-R10]
MEEVGKAKVFAFFDDTKKIKQATNSEIRAGDGHPVSSYLELAKKVAELQFYNQEHVLFFRGQPTDFKNSARNTTLKPSILRSDPEKPLIPPVPEELRSRFEELKRYERRLMETLEFSEALGRQRVARHRLLRWSILQHYEKCGTPLLDVSQSIRIAASFASVGRGPTAFVYVLAVPNISGVISASAEAGLQTVKLAGICPPNAVRPYIQEGYLLGEYPEMPDFEQKQNYRHYEIDFGRRLIAKFCLDLRCFWADPDFPKVARTALYPNSRDPLFKLLKHLG